MSFKSRKGYTALIFIGLLALLMVILAFGLAVFLVILPSMQSQPPVSPPIQQYPTLPPDYECKPGQRMPCGVDSGACRGGYRDCGEDAKWGQCQEVVEPTDEICGDGQDNDCDGSVDEGCGGCVPGQEKKCGIQQGECVFGEQICTEAGTWTECEGAISPVPEVCGDGVDNDCDGYTDAFDVDDCACTPGDSRGCSRGFGICSIGTQECMAGGVWGDCSAPMPGEFKEICGDGLDNDCDSFVDSLDSLDCACNNGEMQNCSNGPGICGNGTKTCSNNIWLNCSAPKPGDFNETCGDGLDNDCDGLVDEACECNPKDTKECGNYSVGECKKGTQTCSDAGIWGDCVGDVDPVIEVCGDGKDNDCDALTDCDDFDCWENIVACPPITANLHLEAYFNTPITVEEARRYKVVITQFSPQKAYYVNLIKAQYPELIVLGYKDIVLLYDYESEPNWSTAGESWFVHDETGLMEPTTRLRLDGPGNPPYVMNVANLGWQNAYMNYVVNKLTNSTYSNYNGIFEDDSWVVLKTGRYVGGKNPHPSYFAPWHGGMIELLDKIDAAIGSKYSIPNSEDKGQDPPHDEYITHADGMMDEGFVHAPWTSDIVFKNVGDWKRDVDYLKNKGTASAIYLAQSGTLADIYLENSAENEKIMMFTFTSFLLGMGDTTTYSYKPRDGGYSQMWHYDAYDVNLGNSVGAYYLFASPDLYAREFERVLVIVNPKDSNHNGIDLGTDYETLDGDIVDTIDLDAYEGIILKKTSSS